MSDWYYSCSETFGCPVGAARCGILMSKMLLSFRGHNLRHFSQGSNQFQFTTATSRCHICKHKMEANCCRERRMWRKKAGAGQAHFSYCSLPLDHNSVVVSTLLLVDGGGLAAICSCQFCSATPTWFGWQLKVVFTPYTVCMSLNYKASLQVIQIHVAEFHRRKGFLQMPE